MKEHLIQEVQRQMLPYLNNAQLKQLKAVLEKALTGVTVHRDKAADVSESVDTVFLPDPISAPTQAARGMLF